MSTKKPGHDFHHEAELYDGLASDKSDEHKTREEAADLEEKQRIRDIEESMKHPEVRRMLWRFLERAGILAVSFDNSGWTAFKEGRREQGLFQLAQVEEVVPDALLTMRADTVSVRKKQNPNYQE